MIDLERILISIMCASIEHMRHEDYMRFRALHEKMLNYLIFGVRELYRLDTI